jgi:hypothetical protein
MSFNLSNLYRSIINDILLHDTRICLVDSISQKTIYKVLKYYFTKQILELKPNYEKIISASEKISNATDTNLMEVILNIAKDFSQNNMNSLTGINNFSIYYMFGISILSSMSEKINGVFKKTELLEVFKTQYSNSNHTNHSHIESLLVSFLSSLFAKFATNIINYVCTKIIIDDKTENNIRRITEEILEIIDDDDPFDLINKTD